DASQGALSSASIDAAKSIAPPPADSVTPAALQGGSSSEALYHRLFSYVAENCYADELGPSEYTNKWVNYRIPRSEVAADAIMPAPPSIMLQDPRSRERKKRMEALKKDWLAPPRTHVIDCKVYVQKQSCLKCGASFPPAPKDPPFPHSAASLPA